MHGIYLAVGISFFLHRCAKANTSIKELAASWTSCHITLIIKFTISRFFFGCLLITSLHSLNKPKI